jgi:hypothetical protein
MRGRIRYWQYPLKHFLRHPYLVTLVMWDYTLRRWYRKPDEWYWADRRLMELTTKEGTF